MNKNEIKKALYRQKPMAYLKMIRKEVAYYESFVTMDEVGSDVCFEVPVNDMGDADLLPTMDAKLLIRWMV